MIDVAVAGGGPAGSAVAALLARDHGVTVFEDHPRIGLPEQCAGLLTDRAIETSGVSPDILSTLYGAEVLLPGGGRVTVRSERPKARAVDRSDLDSRMADRAMGARKPPPVKLCSLYSASRDGISSPWGQWLTQ